MKTGKLVCPACGHTQGIDPKYAGQQFACPGCGKAATVHVEESLSAPPPSPDGAGSAASGSGAAGSSGSAGAEQAKAAAQAMAAGAKTAISGLYAAGKGNPLFVSVIIDGLLDKMRGLLKADRFLTQARVISRLGHYIALLVAVGCIPFSIVLAVRMQSWQLALAGPLLAIIVLFLQYVAGKFLDLAGNMGEGTEICFSSKAFFDVGAASCLMIVFLGIVLLAIGIFSPEARMLMSMALGGRGGAGLEAWIGMGVLALFLYFSCYLYLHPEQLLNAKVNPRTTGGENFMSLLAVGARALLTLVPFIFGLGCLASGGMTLYHGVGSLFSEYAQSSFQNLSSSMGAFLVVLLSPLFLYLFVLAFYFFLDLALAVFRIARNTEK